MESRITEWTNADERLYEDIKKHSALYTALKKWIVDNTNEDEVINFKQAEHHLGYTDDLGYVEYNIKEICPLYNQALSSCELDQTNIGQDRVFFFFRDMSPAVEFWPSLNWTVSYGVAYAVVKVLKHKPKPFFPCTREKKICDWLLGQLPSDKREEIRTLGKEISEKELIAKKSMSEIPYENGSNASDNQVDGERESISFAKTNILFNPRIFTKEEHYCQLRSILSKFISMDDNEYEEAFQIKPSCNAEWFYILKGIKEARISQSVDVSITTFVRQMYLWFPNLFILKNDDTEKQMIRRYMGSISNQAGKWKKDTDKNSANIIDMYAIAQTERYNLQWSQRVIGVSDGLRKKLVALKNKIQSN